MTALSEKALAFSVDHLLGKIEKQAEQRKRDQIRDTYKEELCASMGEEPPCCHSNVIELLDPDERIVRIELCQPDLWEAFHRLGTEMIITKTGRRMFPAVRVRLSGLKRSAKYKISMEFVCVDKHKYRYVYHSSKWMVSGVGENPRSQQCYQHPDSPMTGDQLMSQVISFEKIKLTNNERAAPGQISLMSMQKFQPRIVIEEVTSDSKGSVSVTFPQTAFIAVTAYQNQEITRLKIARNPFAKGFREAGKCRSSLEAMMASFGVVINPGNDEIIRKRHMTDDVGSLMDLYSSPLKRPYGLLMPVPEHYQSFQSSTSAPYSGSTAQSGIHYSGLLDYRKHDINTHISDGKDNQHDQSSSKPVTLSDSRSSQSSVHPALLPWQVFGQTGQLFDQRLLGSYYPGLLYAGNPFTHLLYSQAKTTCGSDERTRNSDSVCTAGSSSMSD